MTTAIGQFPGNAITNAETRVRIDRCSNGVIWACITDSGSIEMWYSDDDGSTWQEDTTGGKVDTTIFDAAALFIDVDDYAHVIWFEASTGEVGYRRGTPNAGRTSWTWSSIHTISTVGNQKNLSLIAHKEGTGWKVHGTWTRYFSTGQSQIVYWRIDITSGGTISTDDSGTDLAAVNNPTSGEDPTAAIDFNHTGDGKTVAGSAPHVYVSYSMPDAGGDIWFRKLTYSAGTWSLGTARNLDTDHAFNTLLAAAFDGSRMVTAFVRNGSGNDQPRIAERNAADTTTDTRTPPNPSDITNIEGIGVTYDNAGNIHLWVTSQTYVKRIKYDRAGDSWDSSWTTVATGTTGSYANSLGVKKGYSESTIDAIWQDFDAGTPYAVNYESLSVNAAPTAPTIDSPASGSTQDVAEVLPIDWTFNDPDEGDTQGAYSLRKQIGTGSYSYWNGSVFTATEDASTKISSAGTIHTLSASWGSDSDANHKYAIKTWDAADAGPSAWTETTVTPSAQDNPTVTAITTVTGPTYDVVWTVSTQTKYQVKVYADSGGSPVTSSSFYDSGIQVSTVSSHTTPFPDNNVTRHVGVTTWNDEGLQSDEDTEQLEVDYEAPPTPTVANSTTGTESAAIFVNVTNPSPGAGETTTDSNEIYRRVAADGGDGIRVATGVASSGAYTDWGPLSEVVYQYRARAINTGNGTGTYGAWTT